MGKAFLHHLTHEDEALYLSKVAALLREGGEARFVEPAVNSRILDSVRTLTANIAAELGEAPAGSDHYRVLFLTGVLLSLVSFIPADRAAAQPSQSPAPEIERAERERLIAALTAFPLPWTSDEGYKKAEVTGGGVALEEVDPSTLESRRHKGLFGTRHNLRDHMSEVELSLTALAETSAAERASRGRSRNVARRRWSRRDPCRSA